MTLREALSVQAAFVSLSLEEAEAAIAQRARVEPTFASFVSACVERGVELTVLSSGIHTLIARALARADLAHVAVCANDAEIRPDGWRMTFRDESDGVHDKAAAVREAADRGMRTVYVGDGISDFEASTIADVRFAKRGRALETYLTQCGRPFVPFADFSEVECALFGHVAAT
jgi:2-hydroxy-3-keto-5-methylthiopentenyl-1-phosphate phosphatase